MPGRLDDESAYGDRYGWYYGQRSRLEESEAARLDSRDCARTYVSRDERAYADSRTVVVVRRRRRREQD